LPRVGSVQELYNITRSPPPHSKLYTHPPLGHAKAAPLSGEKGDRHEGRERAGVGVSSSFLLLLPSSFLLLASFTCFPSFPRFFPFPLHSLSSFRALLPLLLPPPPPPPPSLHSYPSVLTSFPRGGGKG
jgi:hypothetical protein